ncbi:hypothetical protein [Microviridae sp.]|nr:hypothetical protein [Microviridae sp.]
MSWEAAIGAAGNIIGGALSGGSGGKTSGKDYEEAAFRTLRGRYEAAQRFGLHPLFTMGMSTPGPATSLKESSGLGAGISNAAQTIAGAATFWITSIIHNGHVNARTRYIP